MSPASLRAAAVALRREFDASFAADRPEGSDPGEGFLRLRIAGRSYAVRLRELQGLHQGRATTSVPSKAPGLIGLAGIQGQVVPVFDLAVLLDHPPAAQPRWMAVCAGPEPVALAFEGFEGQVRVQRSELARGEVAGSTLLDVAALVERLRERAFGIRVTTKDV